MSFFPASGRSGLDEIKVTPAVFLQLRGKLAKGDKLPFNESQLLGAFNRYLQNTKGKWTRTDIKEAKNLHEFAKDYVARETRILEKRFGVKKDRPLSPRSVSAKQRQAEKFIDQHGLRLLDNKSLPTGEMRDEKSSSLANQKNLERGVDASEIIAELLTIARSAEPGTATAAILLSYAMMPNMSSMAIRGTHILLDKFENHSNTSQEKEAVLHGLEIVTAQIAPQHFNQELLRIQEKEKENPSAKPDHITRMEMLKGANNIEAEKQGRETQQIKDFKNRLALFQTNSASMNLSENYAQKTPTHAIKTAPLQGSMDWRKGPKPPDDAIFGIHKTQDDDL